MWLGASADFGVFRRLLASTINCSYLSEPPICFPNAILLTKVSRQMLRRKVVQDFFIFPELYADVASFACWWAVVFSKCIWRASLCLKSRAGPAT